MTQAITIKPHKDHVDHRTALLRFYLKERGGAKDAKGYQIPRTTNRDVSQLPEWWDAECRRARDKKPWHRDR